MSNKITPIIKSSNACFSQSLLDFLFLLLICASPPYKYIIPYTYTYVNTFYIDFIKTAPTMPMGAVKMKGGTVTHISFTFCTIPEYHESNFNLSRISLNPDNDKIAALLNRNPS